MKALVILVAALTVACGHDDTKEETKAERYMTPEYRDAFQEVIGMYFAAAPDVGYWDNVRSITIEEIESGAEGRCLKSRSTGNRWIELEVSEYDSELWNALRKRHLLHELGHCVHNLPHNPRYGSIMEADVSGFGIQYWNDNITIELNRMFEAY